MIVWEWLKVIVVSAIVLAALGLLGGWILLSL